MADLPVPMELPEDEDSILAMNVKQVVLDPRNQTPIVILESIDGKFALPIWIGPYEATAIILSLEEVEVPRPMTHDLLVESYRALGARLEYVIIHEVKDGTFFAELALDLDGRRITVDARPSDSIAIALRADAPILAERAVCDSAEKIDAFLLEAQAEQYKAFLDAWDPKDVTKYKI